MKLPIGIQNFEKIREGGYVYVDKTKEIFELINTYTYVFLARPRRFGKSLLLDTMKCLFEGKKELFEGLYIYDKWEFEKYPVIKISWDGKLRSIKDLEKNLKYILNENQERLDVNCSEKEDMIICFKELVKNAFEKHQKRVVILIDEYDKPILDVIEDLNQAKEHREYIKGLYSTLKGLDEYIKFAFLTGVSKFSKASIFSGLNMLSDISLLPKYGNICGITEEEIKINFEECLIDVDFNEMKEWYNGYYFLKDKIYNPFDLLQYFQNKIFKNYWFSSGNPSFLIKLLKENNYYLPNLSNLKVDEKLLDVFDIEKIDVEVLLYQAGYLTIKDVFKTPFGQQFKLYFPNKEVKVSFCDYLIDYFFDIKSNDLKIELYMALIDGDINKFIEVLKKVFSSIPYNNLTYIKQYEGFYSSVVFVFLQSLGFNIIGEDVTNKGRIDLSLFVEDKVYIIEFKVTSKKDQTNCGALKQIKEKKYYEKYQKREVYLVGICFDKKEKNIFKYEWEKLYNES